MRAIDDAGLARRLAAAFYDTLLTAAVLLVAGLAALSFTGGQAVPAGNPWFMLYLGACVFGFFGWFWTHGGQTLGLRAWRLRVVRADGAPLRWRDAALRFLAAVPSLGLFGIGLLWVLVDRERRAWHDRASGTRVVRTDADET